MRRGISLLLPSRFYFFYFFNIYYTYIFFLINDHAGFKKSHFNPKIFNFIILVLQIRLEAHFRLFHPFDRSEWSPLTGQMKLLNEFI